MLCTWYRFFWKNRYFISVEVMQLPNDLPL